MTEGPFRHAGWHSCPSCSATLREFQSRLICDHCGGIWIGEADLASAIGDQRAEAPPELIARDAKRTETGCPSCPDALESCKLDVKYADGTIKHLKQPFLRCARDGLWCKPDVLAAVLAVIGTRGFGGGTRGYQTPFETVQTGLDGLPVMGGGPRSVSDGLAISAWRKRPRQRTKTLSPVNAYADRALGCPVCPSQELRFLGDRYGCEQCAGLFVENAAVAAMVNEIAPAYWELPAASGTVGERSCPVCRELLVTEVIETVAIDRCGAHGVWFDPKELATMLEHASGNVHEGGLRRWLARLFA